MQGWIQGKKWMLAAGCMSLIIAGAAGCETTREGNKYYVQDAHGASLFSEIDEAVAVIMPTEGNSAEGWVRFESVDEGVRVTAEITGLTPYQQHGFHVHQYGDCTAPDGTAAGGHYNPGGHPHALPNGDERHAGDLGNLEANSKGMARYEAVFDNITIAGMKNPVLGRGVIVHAQPDDGGQPTGNAGARIGQGVIGVANPG